jgi:DNA-binding PadR family transcriptional regulator
MAKRRPIRLSTADLVLLSLIAERPLHGYQANAELERRQVRDWAGVSRPQVYYSLEKLSRLGFLRAIRSNESSEGPERQVYSITRPGLKSLADSLEREDWCTQRERPSFLTWMALSWRARKGVSRLQLERRRRYLETELVRERRTLQELFKEVGHPFHEAVWMVKLMIRQFETELHWISQVRRELAQRAPARHAVRQIDNT